MPTRDKLPTPILSTPSLTTAGQDLIFYGDPHGIWEPLLLACVDLPPDGVILVGDLELERPLHQQIAPIFEAGIRVWWIAGNHDAHSAEAYGRLWDDHPSGNLHGQAAEIGGVVVAGLGGIFKARVWYPREDPAAASTYRSRAQHLKRIPRVDRWRGGLPLGMRETIFPEDIEALRKVRADVLVAHEAPSCHRFGFTGIDMAARACGARFVVHGHHHEAYEVITGSGVRVRGLGQAEVFRFRGENAG